MRPFYRIPFRDYPGINAVLHLLLYIACGALTGIILLGASK